MTLYLTVSVFECKKGQLFPQSDWTSGELRKILHLSGVTGTLPDHFDHESYVNLLIDRLNIQRPPVYALSTSEAVIVNSQTVQVQGDRLNIGPYAVLQTIHDHTCQHIWHEFISHVNRVGPTMTIVAVSEEKLREKQNQILLLEQKLATLQESDLGRMNKQLSETNHLLRKYRDQLLEEKKNHEADRDKNLSLLRHIEQLQAQLILEKEHMDRLRNQLITQGPGGIEALQACKRRVQDLEKEMERERQKVRQKELDH
jgi:hypothetical protein